jgi:hypothetical protein
VLPGEHIAERGQLAGQFAGGVQLAGPRYPCRAVQGRRAALSEEIRAFAIVPDPGKLKPDQ